MRQHTGGKAGYLMSIQSIDIETNSNYNKKITIEMRPEWTQISLGRDFTTTACIIANRILITRTCGFVASDDAVRYCRFIGKVIS